MSRRLTLKQRRFIDEYIRNNGNATQAALQVYDTHAKVARSMGAENMAKPCIQREIERRLSNGGIVEEALEVTLQALHAKTHNGKPHWVSCLRAADMIFRLSGAYDKKMREEKQPVVDIQADWSGVHPKVAAYYARTGIWPDDETQQKLIEGKPIECNQRA